MDITKLSPRSGRVVAENGQKRNIVDMLGGGTPVSGAQYDITQFSPRSGRLIGEDGKLYNLVDLIGNLNATIEELQNTVDILTSIKRYIGVTTTVLYDKATTNPITINGVSVTAVNGDAVMSGDQDFVWNGTNGYWDAVPNAFGALAYKNSASGDYTPAGTVSVTKTTDTITEVASVGSLPSFSYDPQTETVSFNAGSLPMTSDTNVVTDASATFSGTQTTITVE